MYQDLSDYENMVDEMEIEPDYYIDRPQAAVFLPDPEGQDKATVLDGRHDKDLFDFD
jgi:hypothetical protein